MYQRALAGYEKTWGREHTSTLGTVNNLGNLYAGLGMMEDAEKMLQRALDGYAAAVSADSLSTNVPALNNMWAFASLRDSQGRTEDARHWYSQALRGYEKTFGQDHSKCLRLRNKLADVARQEEARDALADKVSTHNQGSVQTLASPRLSLTRPVSKRPLRM
jgi:tetratricopeptide (TPR) repeat protein